MKILVACEESQAVTIELRKLGHEAYSCDILEQSGGHPEWHIKGDAVAEAYSGKYDMMICFTPCTHLALSGSMHFKAKIADGRQKQGIDLFMSFVYAPIEKIAIENPLGIMSSKYRAPDQIIQPWMFGDKAQKSTCLWLKNINKLQPTNVVEKGEFFEWVCKKTGKTKRQPMWYYNALTQAKTPAERSTLRSKTFPGIAEAMAKQFTKPLLQKSLF
jgi:hypothetical protein